MAHSASFRLLELLEDELPDMLNHLICQRVDDFSHIRAGLRTLSFEAGDLLFQVLQHQVQFRSIPPCLSQLLFGDHEVLSLFLLCGQSSQGLFLLLQACLQRSQLSEVFVSSLRFADHVWQERMKLANPSLNFSQPIVNKQPVIKNPGIHLVLLVVEREDGERSHIRRVFKDAKDEIFHSDRTKERHLVVGSFEVFHRDSLFMKGAAILRELLDLIDIQTNLVHRLHALLPFLQAQILRRVCVFSDGSFGCWRSNQQALQLLRDLLALSLHTGRLVQRHGQCTQDVVPVYVVSRSMTCGSESLVQTPNDQLVLAKVHVGAIDFCVTFEDDQLGRKDSTYHT
mmetsp:Transcript_24584/g.57885  ORF Transcript_24584/g.57885 Transcript_24584/m.57885 type:complete len:341 (-) Transcript_24584:413-1435(-)